MAPPKLRISPIGPRESSTQPSSTMEELPKNLNLIPISPDYNMDAETIRREIMQDLGLEDPEEVNSPKAIIISDDEGMEEKEKIPLKIPIFTGKPSEWSIFKYLFASQLDAHPTFTQTYKLYMLRKHLNGTALNLIKSSHYGAKQYREAWEKITKTYDNINMDIQRVLHKLVHQAKAPGDQPRESAPIKCALCTSSEHETWECPKFLLEKAKGKTDQLIKANLCFKCFRKHGIGKCTKGNCHKCKGAHHLMICYQMENERRRPKGSVPTTISNETWDTNN